MHVYHVPVTLVIQAQSETQANDAAIVTMRDSFADWSMPEPDDSPAIYAWSITDKAGTTHEEIVGAEN